MSMVGMSADDAAQAVVAEQGRRFGVMAAPWPKENLQSDEKKRRYRRTGVLWEVRVGRHRGDTDIHRCTSKPNTDHPISDTSQRTGDQVNAIEDKLAKSAP